MFLSDLALTPPAGRPLMMLAVPVRDRGALILEIDPDIFCIRICDPGPRRPGLPKAFL